MAITKVTRTLLSTGIDDQSNATAITIDSSENVGIGTSSPYTPLEVAAADSIIRLTVTGGVADKSRYEMRAIGASGYEGLQFRTVNDANNSYNVLMHLDYDGNVGIGTSSPSNKLDVAGNVSLATYSGTSENQTILAQNDYGQMRAGIRSGIPYIGSISALDFALYTGNTERMRIDSSGNVGIGNSNPSAFNSLGATDKLVIGDSTDSNLTLFGTTYGSLAFADSDTSSSTAQYAGLIQYYHTNNSMQFYTSSTEAMRIDSLGRVGIGETSPSGSLHIKKSSDTADLILESSGGSGREYLIGSRTDGSLNVYDVTGSTERMRIDSSGNLNVAKTSSSMTTAGCRLGANGGSEIVSQGNNNVPLKVASADDTYIALVEFYTASGTQCGYILGNGSAVSLVSNSDYRLKENIVDLTGALDRVNQLQPKIFNFIADETNTLVDGFLAHEVQDIVPEAITGEKDAVKEEEYEITPAVLDDDGNVVTEAVIGTREVPEYQGIDQSKLVPLLTKAIQELSDKVDNQQTIIDNLTTRIETLENA
jgi:hypothetical protein